MSYLFLFKDPEMIWLANQKKKREGCQQQLEQQQQEEQVAIAIDTVGDQSLQLKEDDYIPFPAFSRANSYGIYNLNFLQSLFTLYVLEISLHQTLVTFYISRK